MKKIVDSNDIKVYSSEILQKWDEKTFFANFKELPDFIQRKIAVYDNWLDRQLRIEGKLLLKQLLKEFNFLNLISLEDLKYTDNNRPYFETGFDFSISHTGSMVFCAGTVKKRIGLDAEIIKNIDLEVYTEYFHPNELECIKNSDNPLRKFYKLWTRKEALAKASGMGVMIPLKDLDVSSGSIEIDNKLYVFTNLEVSKNCMVSMACSE